MKIQGVRLIGERVVDASVILPNLAIWIDANNATSYSGSGTSVTDLSGNGRTQVLSSAGIYTMLSGVKCWDCSSGNDIQASVTGPTLPTTGFTYIAWARMKASSADFRTLFRSLPDDHALLIQVGTDNLGMYDNPTNSFYGAGATVGQYADVWTQWCVTGDSSGQTFYINGQPVGTTVQTAAGNSHKYFGGLGIGQSFGYVANMFLYTSKLTQEQVLQNYYNQLPTFQLPNVVTSNLVLWYDPGFTTSYPGTGTTITNLANTSLPGTMSNITYTDPYFAYNGSTSQVTIADNALLEPGSGDWSMEAWVYLGNNSGSKVILGKFDPGGLSADVSYSMRISGSNAYAQYGDGTGTFANSTGYTMPLNTWTHLAYVYKTGATKTIETFINGVSIGTANHTLNSLLNTPSNLYIGSYNGGEYSQWMNGRIGATRLYNAALTSAQVLQNYTADRGTYGV